MKLAPPRPAPPRRPRPAPPAPIFFPLTPPLSLVMPAVGAPGKRRRTIWRMVRSRKYLGPAGVPGRAGLCESAVVDGSRRHPGSPHPPPARSLRPLILSRRPMCSVMLTLLLFSLSFREKKRRRIEELLAEKLVLPGGGDPSPGTPASPHPRPRGPAAAAPGGWEGGTWSAGRAASSPDPRPAAPGDRRSAPGSLSQAGTGPGVHRSRSGADLPEYLIDLKGLEEGPVHPSSSSIPNCQRHDLFKRKSYLNIQNGNQAVSGLS